MLYLQVFERDPLCFCDYTEIRDPQVFDGINENIFYVLMNSETMQYFDLMNPPLIQNHCSKAVKHTLHRQMQNTYRHT